MTENIKKYGSKESDIITIQNQMNRLCFVGFIFGNIQKYLKRYISESNKANNSRDIEKVLDYVARYEEIYTDVDFSRLKKLIESKEYKDAFIHSKHLQEDLLFKENIGDLVGLLVNNRYNSAGDTFYYTDNNELNYFYTKYKIYDGPIRFIKKINNQIIDNTKELIGKDVDWNIISNYIILSNGDINSCVDKRVLIFYDSFLLHTIQLYFGMFRKMFFAKMNFNEELINIIQPDYIFEFRVERFLN